MKHKVKEKHALTSIKKIIILGLDGLEASIIEREYFPNIEQVEYGRIAIPIVPAFNAPSTPVIWTSFITGKDSAEHGIYSFWTWNNSFISYLQKKFYNNRFLAKILIFSQRFKPGQILRMLGFKKIHIKKKNIKVKTLFDIIKPSIAISVPVVNEDVVAIYGYIEKIGLKETLEKSRINFEKEKLKLLSNLNKPWKFLMVHFQIGDIYGHLYSNSLNKIVKLYQKLDKFVGEVKRKINKNTLCLVISDHGTIGDHTTYGFYSSNIPLNLNDPKITDFYHIILDLLLNTNTQSSNSKRV
ncbi:MAG: alkaline phosphatase family protein [Candidatus Lokiarchaeia archaeon]